MLITSRRIRIYISADNDIHLGVLGFTSRRDYSEHLGGSRFYVSSLQRSTKNKRVKSKFCECPDFSCSRSDGSLEPVTSSFPAASESLRANSQSSVVVQAVRPLSRPFSPVRAQSGKTVVTVRKAFVTRFTSTSWRQNQQQTPLNGKNNYKVGTSVAKIFYAKIEYQMFQRAYDKALKI